MPPPAISVIIPVYNCEQFIGEALDSIYAQIHRPEEIIVVDDGSTDSTANIVENYCFTEKRLQSYLSLLGKISPNAVPSEYRPDAKPMKLFLLSQNNCGPSVARNLGIQHSSGEWISFLDADDVWLPTTIRDLMKLTHKYPQSAIVFGDALNFKESGEALERISENIKIFPKGIIDRAFEYLSKQNAIVNGGAILARRESILRVDGFRKSVVPVEDHDLWLRMALFSQLACTENLVLLRRRRHGALSDNQEAFYRAELRVFSYIKKVYKQILIQQRIDIGKHITDAHYRLAYFYYLHRMPLKATLAMMRLAWARLVSLLSQQKISNTRKSMLQ